MNTPIGILGVGHQVPPHVRTNDDPLFSWLRLHPPLENLFEGYSERRCLGPGEGLNGLMTSAARAALTNAGVRTDQIGALYGYGSVGEYYCANTLFETHLTLGLGNDNVQVIPVADGFTNFNTGLLLATQAIALGQFQYALVVCGCNWTRYMDYHDPVSVSIGDGAGAVVVGRLPEKPSKPVFRYMDSMSITNSEYYGYMHIAPRLHNPLEHPVNNAPVEAYSRPLFTMGRPAEEAFKTWGVSSPPALVNTLLKKNQLSSAQITLISHQASTRLMKPWGERIQPARYLSTIAEFGNMTLATIPVTLSYLVDEITTPYLALLGIGIGMQATALLLERMA